MPFAVRVFVCVLVGLLTGSAAHAQDKPFTHAGVAGRRQALRDLSQGQLATRATAQRELAPRGTRLLAAGTDSAGGLAQLRAGCGVRPQRCRRLDSGSPALLAIKPDQGSERYDLPVNASGAA